MFYNSLKTFIKNFPYLYKFLLLLKKFLIDLSRLKDVLMMMILLHVWPEQTFRFSTRKFLPKKKNKFSKNSKPIIPYELLKFKCSEIPRMKEINIVGRGVSFNFKNLEKINGPIFLVGFWAPLKTDNSGNFYNTSGLGDLIRTDEAGHFKTYNNQVNMETLKEVKIKNLTYINSNKTVIKLLKKSGLNALTIVAYATDKDGKHYPINKSLTDSSYINLIDNDQCKLISVAEKFFKPPLLPPDPHWTQTGSFIQSIYTLLFFAEKVNVYGWDFFLESSPEKMNYFQLFFNMYKYKLDITRSRSHFEEALISFYYGYQFLKLPNVKIHGYMGKLGKHEKLIERIEKVFFR